MLIKIRNSLAISGIRCRIFKNQPPQTHKSPLVGWSKLIFNTFTSPQGGAKLLLLGEKLSSHFTVHSHFTAPKPRCSSWGISYLHASGTISSQKSASSRDGSTQRRADDAKSVTQPSARSQCSTDDATVEKFGKISHWAKAYFMEGGWTDEPPAVSLRAASKTLDSFNRSIVTQDTRKPKSLARVAWIVLFRGASAHLKIKERTRFHMVMVKKGGRYRTFFCLALSGTRCVLFGIFGDNPTRVVSVRKLRWTDLAGVRLGLLAVRCVRVVDDIHLEC